MKTAENESLRDKLAITEAAVELYLSQDGEFTLNQVADETDLEVAEIFDYYPDKNSILSFYYTSLVIRYRLMIGEIDDFDSYDLAEKLSNFIYSSFDLMDEKRAFVEETFPETATRSLGRSEFEKEVESLFRDFFTTDRKVSASGSILMNDYLYATLRKTYIFLVSFWLGDESEDKERTLAFTDKYTAFIQELFYSAVMDKGIDLLKFMAEHNLFIRQWPVIGTIVDKIEIRE